MKEEIKLSDHFGYRKLMRFTMPSIVMLIFTSIYGVVDGLFVSNFVGKTSFAAVNLIMPVLMILGCVGFMFGTGGGALIAMSLGEGKKEKASHIFSFIVAFSAIAAFCKSTSFCSSSIIYLTVFLSISRNSSEKKPITFSTFRHIWYSVSYIGLNCGKSVISLIISSGSSVEKKVIHASNSVVIFLLCIFERKMSRLIKI